MTGGVVELDLHGMNTYQAQIAVDAALLEHLVYQGGFTMVDMGDDGNVTYVFAFCLHKNRNPFFFLLYKCVKTFFRDTIFQFTTFFADYKVLE